MAQGGVDAMSAAALHAALIAELPHHCPAGERAHWLERLWSPARLAARAAEMQVPLQMVYASGWNPAYSFDDVGGAALPAAAAAVGLAKLAVLVTELARMQPPVAAALAVAGAQLAGCRSLRGVSLQLTGSVVAPSLSAASEPLPTSTARVLTRFLRCAGAALEPHCHIRLLRLGLPSSPSPEMGAELRGFVARLRRGAECRRLTVLLGGHPRALRGGCPLAALPAPLLADIVMAAVDLDSCRVEVDMTNPRTWEPMRFVIAPGPPAMGQVATA